MYSNLVDKIGTKFVFKCLECGQPFVSPGYEVRAGRMTKYCSNKCQAHSPQRIKNARKAIEHIDYSGEKNPNYKDGRSFYSKFRKDACEICGATKNKNSKKPLYVHHLDADRTNSSPDNLQTLCASCHEDVHKRWL